MWLGRAAWALDVEARSSTSWLEEALCRFREVNEPAGIGWTLTYLAYEAYEVGNLDAAAAWATDGIETGTASGVQQVVVESRRILGLIAASRGDHSESERVLGEAVAECRQVGESWQLAPILSNLALVKAVRGDHVQALALLSEALQRARTFGAGEPLGWVLQDAIGFLWQRRPREAATVLGATDAAQVRQWPGRLRAEFAPPEPALARGDLKERRLAGRSLSIERAVDLALRVVEEERTAAAKLGTKVSAAEVATLAEGPHPNRSP
jgi:hypothetical protein